MWVLSEFTLVAQAILSSGLPGWRKPWAEGVPGGKRIAIVRELKIVGDGRTREMRQGGKPLNSWPWTPVQGIPGDDHD